MRMTAITKIGSIVCDVMVTMLTCSWTHLYKSRVRSDAWHVASRYKQNSKPAPVYSHGPCSPRSMNLICGSFSTSLLKIVHLVVATELKLQWTKKMLLQKTHYSVDLQCLFIPALHKLSKVVNLIQYKAKQVWCSTESQWQSYDNTLRIVGCHGNSIIEKSNLFKYVDF